MLHNHPAPRNMLNVWCLNWQQLYLKAVRLVMLLQIWHEWPPDSILVCFIQRCEWGVNVFKSLSVISCSIVWDETLEEYQGTLRDCCHGKVVLCHSLTFWFMTSLSGDHLVSAVRFSPDRKFRKWKVTIFLASTQSCVVTAFTKIWEERLSAAACVFWHFLIKLTISAWLLSLAVFLGCEVCKRQMLQLCSTFLLTWGSVVVRSSQPIMFTGQPLWERPFYLYSTFQTQGDSKCFIIRRRNKF